MRSLEEYAGPAPAAARTSPWHSPVPYLFGGLAAMLGLIAFALLILACSYWKLSSYLENDPEANADASDGGDAVKVAPPVLEEKFLVIMAGQLNPTFIATPMSSRVSSFGSTCTSSTDASTVLSDVDDKHQENDGTHHDLDSDSANTYDHLP